MLFENMTLEDFRAVTASKVDGAWNLHNALAKSPLDFFVALSSVSGVVGNRGQAAYAAANVFLDGFMEWRRGQGLPGTTIDLTAVRDVGYLAEVDTKRQQEVLRNIGTDGMTEAEVLALLAAAITGDLAHSCGGQAITGLESITHDHFWRQDAKFSLLATANKSQGGEDSAKISLPLHVQFAKCRSKEEKLQICYKALAAKLARVLVLSVADMEPSVSVSSLALDSLVAIEVRNWIAREANANVQVLEILSAGSLMALADVIVTKSQK
jgi:hypothetical protein